MIKEEENSIKTFYYPCCNIFGCNGIPEIKFNDNFTIDIACENGKHKKKNIFFETFEKFYLKEKKFENCFNCNKNLDNDHKFVCKKCDHFYCISCFINDEHIKSNINNLNIKNNKCQKHQRELINYCFDCKKSLCVYCIKQNENNPHINHLVNNIYDLIPTINQINNLKSKINQKKLLYEELINSLD